MELELGGFLLSDDDEDDAAWPSRAASGAAARYEARRVERDWFLGSDGDSDLAPRIAALLHRGRLPECLALCDAQLQRVPRAHQARRREPLDSAVRAAVRLGDALRAAAYLEQLVCAACDDRGRRPLMHALQRTVRKPNEPFWLLAAQVAALRGDAIDAQRCHQQLIRPVTSSPPLWTGLARSCQALHGDAAAPGPWLWAALYAFVTARRHNSVRVACARLGTFAHAGYEREQRQIDAHLEVVRLMCAPDLDTLTQFAVAERLLAVLDGRAGDGDDELLQWWRTLAADVVARGALAVDAPEPDDDIEAHDGSDDNDDDDDRHGAAAG